MSLSSSLLSKINQDISQFSIPFDDKMLEICDPQVQEIRHACMHPLLAGGKRTRPLLVLLIAGCLGGEHAVEVARKSALAVELLHTYSLVHDDLPCMDNDDYRRGKPTTHKLYGHAKGLLVGDALLTHAFLELSQTDWKQGTSLTALLVQTLAECSGASGMIWGQWLDISFTNKSDTSWDELVAIHSHKTGKLLGACLELGFLCAASQFNTQLKPHVLDHIRKQIRHAGICLGIAFQIVDDILDVTQSSQTLGKTARKDEQQNKATAVSLLGITQAEQYAQKYTHQSLEILENILASLFKIEIHPIFKNELIQNIELLSMRKS